MPSIPLYELWLPGKEEGKGVRTPRLQPCGVSAHQWGTIILLTGAGIYWYQRIVKKFKKQHR
ncbi:MULTISPECIES: hypothetical protein [Priestia]|uniref:hypothetical protein n=1 Tax=Priestia TaxID=2800373 RepID=UPI001155AED0|nr:hypothetical protein [Priestia megaterium]MED3973259.1 hypothetical protein [Priestia megaterium]